MRALCRSLRPCCPHVPLRYFCISHVTLRCGCTAIAWVKDAASLFVSDDEGTIYLFDLRHLLDIGSFQPLPQRPLSTPGEMCVRKHGSIPKLPAKYPIDASWPTDTPKWLARAPPQHSAAFFAKFGALTPLREWRAHLSAVQSLSVCYTVAAQQPSLLSSGDDGHVRLWDMSGACVGSLAQVSVDDLMCRFLN